MPIQRWRRARAGHDRIESHRYGTRRGETLEILRPAPRTPARPPVVYVHGGGWIFGRKELYSADLAFLTGRGHTVYNLEYPLAPEHPFPVPLLSLVAALAWIRRRDPEIDSVHLMGDSAGGNLALMLGLICADPQRFAFLDPALAICALPNARSVVSLYGVLDRLSWLEHGFPGARLMLHCYGGPAAFEASVGPELSLTPMDLDFVVRPPCLLAIGSADPLAESSRIAHARLRESAERIELIEYPGERHGFFNSSWRPASRKLRADVVRFLDEV
jgi:acetyl esterase